MAQILALERVVDLCKEIGLENVQFEGDVRIVIKAIQMKGECQLWYGQIVDDFKISLEETSCTRLHYILRKGNYLKKMVIS